MASTDDDDDQINDQASHPDPFQKRDDGFFSPVLNEPRLPQDYDTPAAPPSDVINNLPRDHPATDSSLEPSEVYDEGAAGASEVDAQLEKEDDRPPTIP